MEKKVTSGIMLTLLLISMLAFGCGVHTAKASGTIFIRPDGSVDGTDSIQRDGDVYTFIEDILDQSIVVEKDNIVVDGGGYTLQGTGADYSNGIDLSGRISVTIKNMKIKAFSYGVLLNMSSNNSLFGNNITNNIWRGILLESSNDNSIYGNNITNNLNFGIELSGSSYNSLYDNILSYNEDPVYLSDSSHNSLFGNTVTNNAGGIRVSGSYNILFENTVANYVGITLDGAHNTLYGNIITNNSVNGIGLGGFNNSLYDNHITNNEQGIAIWYASNNIIFHNSFTDNTEHVHIYTSGYANVWDNGYPSGGNYWSDYTTKYPDAQELDDSGIWDTPYVIDADNRDRYPIMNPWTPTPDFLVTASPTSLTIQQGNSDTSVITVMSLDGFNQPVQLTLSGTPSGVTTALNPEQVTPPPYTIKTSTLTVSVGKTATPGSYTLTVTGTSGILTRSADIALEIAAPQEWMFATITDIHIGRGWQDYGAEGYNDYSWDGMPNDGDEGGFNCLTDRLTDVVKWVNENYQESNIKFLVILGDITDSAEMSEFFRAKNILDGLEIPYIPVIGNHDVLAKTDNGNGVAIGDFYFNTIFDEGFFRQQFEKLGTAWWDKQEHTESPYLQNYAFSYGGINFVSLDFARRDIPELDPWDVTSVIAQPFPETEIWLEDYMKNRSEDTVIVFSHYPFMLEGGVWTSVTGHLGRTALTYSRDILTFGGHIHYCDNRNLEQINDVYFLGELYFETWIPFSTQVSVPVIVTKGLMEMDRDFLRLVNVRGLSINDIDYETIIELETYDIPDEVAPETRILEWQFPCSLTKSLFGWLGSPGELRVYDSQGRVTGVVNGEVKNEIPLSLYSEDCIVVLSESVSSHVYEVVGTDEGSYNLEVAFTAEQGAVTFAAIDIPTSKNAVHQYAIDWEALHQGGEGVTVQVDLDGDGTFEKTFNADNELSQDEFTAQVASVEAFPIWIIAAAVMIIVVGVSLAVYLTKIKKTTRES